MTAGFGNGTIIGSAPADFKTRGGRAGRGVGDGRADSNKAGGDLEAVWAEATKRVKPLTA